MAFSTKKQSKTEINLVQMPADFDVSHKTRPKFANVEKKTQFAIDQQKKNDHSTKWMKIKQMILSNYNKDYFETVNIWGKYLGRAFEYLSTIQPTSCVESEHAFSAAGLFCTKIRSRLSDKLWMPCVYCEHIFLKKVVVFMVNVPVLTGIYRHLPVFTGFPKKNMTVNGIA
jgi:hypothetical protein